MEALFSRLSEALEGTTLAALVGALAWGFLSMVLSPCHLSSIPLVVGFVGGQRQLTTLGAFVIAVLFSLGLLITIAVIGVLTAAMGRIAGDIGPAGNYAVAVVFLLVGVHLFGWLPAPWNSPAAEKMAGKGKLGAFVLGLVFGVALGPCTFAFMAPVLVASLKAASTSPGYSVMLLLAYGVGHCSVILVAGTCTELVQRYLNWNEQSRGLMYLRYGCGGLVILAGAYLVYTARGGGWL